MEETIGLLFFCLFLIDVPIYVALFSVVAIMKSLSPMNYEAPEVELLEMNVEAGFASMGYRNDAYPGATAGTTMKGFSPLYSFSSVSQFVPIQFRCAYTYIYI